MRLYSFFFLAILLLSCSPQEKEQQVLFVCTHGAAKSPMASAFFNQMAKKEGLNIQSVFRGTEPDAKLSEAATNGFKKDGIDYGGWKPSLVTEEDVNNADLIISFDCTVPLSDEKNQKFVKWDGISDVSKDYNQAKKEIQMRLQELIPNLKQLK